jgi:hypothetical protein
MRLRSGAKTPTPGMKRVGILASVGTGTLAVWSCLLTSACSAGGEVSAQRGREAGEHEGVDSLSQALTDEISFQHGVSPQSWYDQPGAKISAGAPTTPNGAYPRHDVGYNGHELRSVLAFDISAIPAGKEIASAKLTLRHAATGMGAKMMTLDLHALTRSFTEADVTWNNATVDQVWAQLGGDFAPVAVSSLSLVPSAYASGGISVFDDTYSFTEAVQVAYTGNKQVFLLLKARNGNAGGASFVRFHSDDAGSSALRPILSVTYRTPVVSVDAAFNATDATQGLQAAIDGASGGRVIVRNMGSPWYISAPIILRSNQEVIFEDGVVVEAKAGAFLSTEDPLFKAREVSNVRLVGRGIAKFKMRRADYLAPPYQLTAEGQHSRHALAIQKARNVEVFNLKIEDAGADGIIVSRIPFSGCRAPIQPTCDAYSENILIRNVDITRSGRNGLSITSARNVVVDNSTFSESWGVAPSFGVDVEPDNFGDRIVNVLLRDCSASHNGGSSVLNGGGFAASVQALNSSSPEPVSLTFLDTHAFDNRRGFSLGGHFALSPTVSGNVDFIRCTTDGSALAGFLVDNKAAEPGVYSTKFEDCKVYDAGRVAEWPITILYGTRTRCLGQCTSNTECGNNPKHSICDIDPKTGVGECRLSTLTCAEDADCGASAHKCEIHGNQRVGAVTFTNGFVQANNRPGQQFFYFSDPTNGQHTLADVSGDFVVENPGGTYPWVGTNTDDVDISFVDGNGLTPMRNFCEDIVPSAVVTSNVVPLPFYHHDVCGLNSGTTTSDNHANKLPIGRKIGTTRRIVLSFDLSHIPAGKSITGATLRFTNPDPGVGSTPVVINLHQLLTPFSDATATWTAPWTAAGGDFASTVLSSIGVVPNAVPGGDSLNPIFSTFPSGAAFVSAVSDAYAGDKVLRLLIKLSDETAADGDRYLTWHSDDVGPASKAVIRPRLTVTYSPGP